jgi:large subunit ribosomal protein L4
MASNQEIGLYNQKLDVVGKVQTDYDFDAKRVNPSLVHQVVVASLAGRRAGTACTKTKAMVSGGGAKPFKQKGTGRARQGSSRSPLMPGGGTTHGPTPRSYEQKVNRKSVLRAIDSLLIDKLNSKSLYVVDKFAFTGKTKEVFDILKNKNINKALFVTNESDDRVILASKNLPNAKAVPVAAVSVYDLVKYENLVIHQDCFKQLLERIKTVWKTQQQ